MNQAAPCTAFTVREVANSHASTVPYASSASPDRASNTRVTGPPGG